MKTIEEIEKGYKLSHIMRQVKAELLVQHGLGDKGIGDADDFTVFA